MSGYPVNHVVTADEFEDEASSYTINGTMATSAGATEVAMAAWTGGVDTSFVFKNGYLYKVEITGGSFNSDVAATTALNFVRVRKGVNTIVGQQLLYTVTFTRGGGNVSSFSNYGYVKNASGADITTSLGVTVARGVGAANAGVYGDANIPLIVTVTRLGLTASFGAGITGIAVAIV